MVTLGIMDGVTGLEKVLLNEFPKATVQHCQFHVAKNALAKVTTRRLKKVLADDIRSIFYASSREKAMKLFATFKDRWQREFPSAVRCLENSIDVRLTFFRYPEEESGSH